MGTEDTLTDPTIRDVAARLQALITELEAGATLADGRVCWMEIDTALHYLHASLMSLDEAADGCNVECVAPPLVASTR